MDSIWWTPLPSHSQLDNFLYLVHIRDPLRPRVAFWCSMAICLISSPSSGKSPFNNTTKQMRLSVNIQPHQYIAALCYSIWKSSLLLQSLPPWHFTGNKKLLSWHSLFTCSALHSWIKQQEYSNSEDRLNESNKLKDCRGKQTEFSHFLFSRTETCALKEQYMLGPYRKVRNSLPSSSYRVLHLYWFRHTSIQNIRRTEGTLPPVHLKNVSLIFSDQDIFCA